MFLSLLKSIRLRFGYILSRPLATKERRFASVLTCVDGGQKEFDNLFATMHQVLGEGQFGTVTLIQGRRPVHAEREEKPSSFDCASQQIKGGGSADYCEYGHLPLDDDGTSATLSFCGDDHDIVTNRNGAGDLGKPALYACKTLRKGSVFKDGVFYAPISPKECQTEVDCLRTLNGEHSCLQLHCVFESPNEILLVSDFCTEGHLLEYQQKYSRDKSNRMCHSLKLPVPAIATIAHQLLDAVSHCAHHGIVHRDIKAQNCMISSLNQCSTATNEESRIKLTLVDFGSGVIHFDHHNGDGENDRDLPNHSTFVGSAFYRSPEMFHHLSYTQKTDVWSAGVVLYVTAFGFPSLCNRCPCNRCPTRRGVLDFFYDDLSLVARNWKYLYPEAMQLQLPKSFFDMLDQCLVYDQNRRPNAKEVLCKSAFCGWYQNPSD